MDVQDTKGLCDAICCTRQRSYTTMVAAASALHTSVSCARCNGTVGIIPCLCFCQEAADTIGSCCSRAGLESSRHPVISQHLLRFVSLTFQGVITQDAFVAMLQWTATCILALVMLAASRPQGGSLTPLRTSQR